MRLLFNLPWARARYSRTKGDIGKQKMVAKRNQIPNGHDFLGEGKKVGEEKTVRVRYGEAKLGKTGRGDRRVMLL